MTIYLLCKLLVLSACGDNLPILGSWTSIRHTAIISDVECVMCRNRTMTTHYDQYKRLCHLGELFPPSHPMKE